MLYGCGLFVFFLVVFAAQPASEIPQRMKHFIDDRTVAGTVTLVAHGNDVVEFEAQGMADIEAGRAMQKDTIFQIMSMTKPVTAIGIMMLAEEGSWRCAIPSSSIFLSFVTSAWWRMWDRIRGGWPCPITRSRFAI